MYLWTKSPLNFGSRPVPEPDHSRLGVGLSYASALTNICYSPVCLGFPA